MSKIGIIGLGHVGRLLAHQLVIAGSADELVLIDHDDQLALALQTDLQDAETALASHLKIIIQDYAALSDAQVVVVAVGKSRLIKDQPMAELAFNHDAIKQVAAQVKSSGFQGIIINLANPNEAITAYLQQQLLLPPKQVLGIGTVLETARLHRAIAAAAKLSSANVTGFVYGQHDGQQVFAWSTVRVNGQALDQSINGHRLDQQQLKVNADLSNWYTLQGMGYNASAACTWTVRIINAILTDEQLALPVAIFQPQYEGYVSFPALIGRQGVGNLLLLNLYPVELAGIKTAAATIRQQLTALQRMDEEND
ncbi:MAG: NAD(P)-binding domain-containing protein [Limosilactobacillus sp.]